MKEGLIIRYADKTWQWKLRDSARIDIYPDWSSSFDKRADCIKSFKTKYPKTDYKVQILTTAYTYTTKENRK